MGYFYKVLIHFRYLCNLFSILIDQISSTTMQIEFHIYIGRCARAGDRVGLVVLINIASCLSGCYVKACMRDFLKSCKAGKCVRLECLKRLYLDCMPRSKLLGIAAKELCPGGCNPCCCGYCKCCTNCAKLCKC